MRLQKGKTPDGAPVIIAQPEAEALPVHGLLRTLKSMYPDVYREVHYEIQPHDANGKPKFEVPEDFERKKET